MKRLMTVLGAMAVVGLMAGTACADLTNFQLGMNEFCLSNCSYPIGSRLPARRLDGNDQRSPLDRHRRRSAGLEHAGPEL